MRSQVEADAGREEAIGGWVKDVFGLPSEITVLASEKVTGCAGRGDEADGHAETEIVFAGPAGALTLIIGKGMNEIKREDIADLYGRMNLAARKAHPMLAHLFGFFSWWVIFAGSMTLFSVCPVCGQSGCPVGAGTVGVLAVFFAFIKQYLRSLIVLIKDIKNKFASFFRKKYNENNT